jgi:hypothetical protein
MNTSSTENFPNWTDGLEKVVGWSAAHEGMWPAVAFRILADQDVGNPFSGHVQALAAHFQATPTPQAPNVELRLQSPLVLAGALSIHDFRALVESWSQGKPGAVLQWLVAPPQEISHLQWQQDVQVAPDYFPFIDPLPKFPTVYREARLSGGGPSFDQRLRDRLQHLRAQIAPYRSHALTFALDYMDTPWGMDSPFLLIHLPIALAMGAEYHVDDQRLVVELHFRPPLKPADLEVRIGAGVFNASLPRLLPKGARRDSNGWDLATIECDAAPGGSRKVWLTRIGMGIDFGWELTIDLGRPISRALVRERFLPRWYAYGFQSLSAEVDVRAAGDRVSRPSDALELALANVCGALGYGVFFAGHMLKSQGVDLIAFDDASGRAYVISATIGNAIGDKLRTLMNVLTDIRKELNPVWEVRPVIITTQPALLPEDLTACYRQVTLVLWDQHLAPLKESPPDLETFAAFLSADPPTPDSSQPVRRVRL